MKEIIRSVRDFNRFYVELLGVMKNRFLGLDCSLTELRIIFEIDNSERITAREIKEKLSLDEGYVSRLVKKMAKEKIVFRKQSPNDKRTYFLCLTEKGREVAKQIDERSDSQVEEILSNLDTDGKTKIVKAMTEIKNIFIRQQTISNVSYKISQSLAEFEQGKKLFQEYADSLSFDLDFQGFQQEIVSISEKYAPPKGALILCFLGKKPIACVGLREISDNIAELKRLYVKPEFRSLKIGRKLMDTALCEAKKMGYGFVRLDSIAEMQAAIALYKKLGFYEIEAYCRNPFETAIFMEKEL